MTEQALQVETKDLAPLHVAYIAYRPGASEPDFAAIQGCFLHVQGWLRAQGLDPLFGRTVGVAYAQGGQMVRYDCCVEVPESVQVATDEIAVQNLPGGRYAVLRMTKDSATIDSSMARFYGEYVPQHGLALDNARPTYEIYWEKTMEYSAPLLAPDDPDPQARLRWVQHEASRVLDSLAPTPLADYVDDSLPIPRPVCGTGAIRLIILGQDPTAKDPAARRQIRTVLNLDRRGGLLVYVARICAGLGLDLRKDVYATNLFKAFFVRPPTQIKEVNVLAQSLPWWLPLLKEELAAYAGVPVITLGEPLLKQLVVGDASPLMRNYWGYTEDWQQGETGPFHYLEASANRLGRTIYPFPHQPSIRTRFYKARLESYLAFVRSFGI